MKGATTGAQAAADLAADRCAPVLGLHMPGCPHVDWTRPVRILSALEDASRPSITVHGPGGRDVLYGGLPRPTQPPAHLIQAMRIRRP